MSCLSYLTYIKLCTLVKRNESMAHTLQAKLKEPEGDENKRGPRPQDLIRLYDIILQVRVQTAAGLDIFHFHSVHHLSNLPRVVHLQCLAELSALQGLEDDHTFQKEVSLKILVYKAYRSGFCHVHLVMMGGIKQVLLHLMMLVLLRCFFIAQSYVLVKKWSEALVLYERVLKYAKEVQSKAKSLNNSLKVGPQTSVKTDHISHPELFCEQKDDLKISPRRISQTSRISLLRSTLRSILCRRLPF